MSDLSTAQIMEEMKKSRIRVYIEGQAENETGVSKFGGRPDVVADFEWPYYVGVSLLDNEEKRRPLSFLAQFNCTELAKFDTEGLLPKSGLLSFFYEEETSEWGYDPKHKGCAKVFYFAKTEKLVPADFPEDLAEDYRNPEIGIRLETQLSYPVVQDIQLKYDISGEAYEDVEEYMDEGCCVHQILGWPGIIQNNITTECELIQKGYYLGRSWEDIPSEEKALARQVSIDKWQLLFQLDEVEHEEFYLSFGDCGRLYFYIQKDDLKNCNFENVWLVYQCF